MLNRNKLKKGSTSSFRFPKSKTELPKSLTVQYPVDPSWPAVDKTLGAQLLAVTNSYRQSLGLSTLEIDVNALGSSEWKARNMAAFMYMQHDDPAEPAYNNFPGRTVVQRFVDWGFTNVAWGENIAYGLLTAQDVLNAFLSDIGHRQNVENTSWTHCGMAACRASNGLIFWVQDYVATSVTPPPPPPPTNNFTLWVGNDYPLLQKSTQYKNWVKNNPAEGTRLTTYINNLGTMPTMATPFGKFLVSTVKLISGS